MPWIDPLSREKLSKILGTPHIYFYADGLGTDGSSDRVRPPEWEMYDLVADPRELTNIATNSHYADVRAELEAELDRLQKYYVDQPYVPS